MNLKVLIIIVATIVIIAIIYITSVYLRLGFWTGNQKVDKNELPTAAECDRDFKEGITTKADVIKVRGNPTRRQDSSNLYYRTSPKQDSGCSYQFDKDGKLLWIAIQYPPVG